MKIVGGMKKTWRAKNLTTNKVHAVNTETSRTYCGVDYENSEILGIAMEGMLEEVNCKRCLKRSEGEVSA